MTALYKANSENKVTNEVLFIDAGVREPLELVRIENKISKNGNKFLAIYLKDKSGAEVSKTEWEPKDNDPKILQQKADRLMARLNHMLVDSGILREEEMKFEVNSFDELGQKLIDLVITSGRNKGKYIRAKVVYDDNGFTTLPNYTKYTWIESVSVPKEESKIKLLSIDKIERVKADAPNAANINPFDTDPDIDSAVPSIDNDPFA